MGAPSGNVPPPPPPGMGASQLPLVQLAAQQSAPVKHAPLVGTQATAGSQVFVVVSQCLPQHSPSVAHVAWRPLHAVGGSVQRPFTHRSFLLVAPQQPDWGPELQSSPVGRHVEFAASTTHSFLFVSQRPEQQSVFPAHV